MTNTPNHGGRVSRPAGRGAAAPSDLGWASLADARLVGGSGDPPSTISIPWLAGMLQASDSFYPTGSYAHSFGLEGLTQEGVVGDRETLRGFLLHSVLPTLRQADLPLTAHAWRALSPPPPPGPDWERVGELCELSAALKTASEARSAAENIGRQRSELAALLHGGGASLAAEFCARAARHGWPHSPAVAAALEARILGAPLEAALATVFYSTIAGLLAAAMKLLRIGQNGCQTLLAEMLTHAPRTIEAARSVPADAIGWFNPWLDTAAARHEQSPARLFIS
ncbi:urease accessory protein UreF [Opitutaceae bacterium TAV3]|nr:urease accessory protein UreF [Opitutaceae bacterium TAV3]